MDKNIQNKKIDKRYVQFQQIKIHNPNRNDDKITKKKEIPSIIKIYFILNQYIIKKSFKYWIPKNNLLKYKKYNKTNNDKKNKKKLFNKRNIKFYYQSYHS